MAADRSEYPLMPDEKLKRIYKSRLSLRGKLTIAVIAVSALMLVIYFVAGFFDQTIFSPRFTNPAIPVVLPIIFYLTGVVSSLFMMSDSIKLHIRCAEVIIPLQGLIILCELILGVSPRVTQIVLFFVSFGSHLGVIPIIKDIEALRACPTYPFDSWSKANPGRANSKDRTPVDSMKDVRASGFEDIFVSDKNDRKPGDPDPGEFFQSHSSMNYNYLNRK